MDVQHELPGVARPDVEAAREVLGDRLRAAALFGSVARGEARVGSSVDLLLGADGLPPSRLAREHATAAVDDRVEPALSRLRDQGLHVVVNPIWKTPDEAVRFTPLYPPSD